MHVHERTPYAGDLVFTAFSGSHQDAISKGMAWREEGKSGDKWTVPYLPIDPKDLGREYESDVIRINSQSGKGGVAFILKQNFGITLPEKMREEVGYLVKGVSDRRHSELTPDDIFAIFEESYVKVRPHFELMDCHFVQKDGGIETTMEVQQAETKELISAKGNGRLDAVSNALKEKFGVNYVLSVYEEHAISLGSSSKAVAFVGILHDSKMYWGVGINEDIIRSSIDALVSAVNKIL